MNKTVTAKKGNKFTLTAIGFEIGRIAAKYEENYAHRNQYLHTVPQSWVEKGYVQEVPDNG